MNLRPLRSPGAVLAVAALALAGLGLPGGGRTLPASAATSPTAAGVVGDLLPLSASADHRIVDSAGRDVLLRGANLNSLGEYWRGVSSIDPTVAVTNADWDAMSAHGLDVVRLLISWSRVEPTRGTLDQSYLGQVDAAVKAAAAHGIYSVIDMHQDAYTAFLHTADPSTCPAGTTPAKGWDGAPAWAVLSDGLSTCLTGGDRNSSPAVNRAWNNFYDDVSGIRTEFAAAWSAVASRFAGRPEVAGYDLLNEPEVSRPAAELTPIYSQFLAQVVLAIRKAEAGASFAHLKFIEPGVPAGDPTRGLVIPDPASAGLDPYDVVASAHNYAESISVPGIDLTIESTNDLIASVSKGLGVPVWGGEYGFFDQSDTTLAKARRYAADEDRHAWGGAWWQWRQSCGDPHAVQFQGNQVVAPGGISVQLNLLDCPGNSNPRPNDAFLHILRRAYPRTTPGRITRLVSDPGTGDLSLDATADAPGGRLVVWSPSRDDTAHPVLVRSLADVTSTSVDGGRLITATVAAKGAYALRIGTADPLPPETTTTTSSPAVPGATVPGTNARGTTTPPPASAASAVAGRSRYTG
jgi:endoglycosylceramidase